MTLIFVGFVAGLVTGLSPCILPVLPGILAVSSLGPAQRPGVPSSAVPVGVPATAPGPPDPAASPGAGRPQHRSSSDRRRPYLIIAGLLTSFTVLTLLR